MVLSPGLDGRFAAHFPQKKAVSSQLKNHPAEAPADETSPALRNWFANFY